AYNQVSLSWTASTDTGGPGVAGYKIYRGGAQVGTSTTPAYTDTGLHSSTTYSYTVAAYDTLGSTSAQSSADPITTPAGPPPTTPTGLGGSPLSYSQIQISWSASTDPTGPGLGGYKVYRNGSQIGTTGATSYTDSGLIPSTTYTYTVAAYDTAGVTS